MTSVEIESRCVGCEAPMTYVVETHGSGSPMAEPEESHAVSYAHGHLCASCAVQVKVLLGRLRQDRAALQPRVAAEIERLDREHREDRFPRARSYEESVDRRAAYRCSVPMCGESGVCDECRRRGAR